MKLDLLTYKLYTDKGIFLKKLRCPEKIKASELRKISDGAYNCSLCQKSILDTAELDDDQLTEIMKTDPTQCLKVNLNQSNLNIL